MLVLSLLLAMVISRSPGEWSNFFIVSKDQHKKVIVDEAALASIMASISTELGSATPFNTTSADLVPRHIPQGASLRPCMDRGGYQHRPGALAAFVPSACIVCTCISDLSASPPP